MCRDTLKEADLGRVGRVVHDWHPPLEGGHLEEAEVGGADVVKVHARVVPRVAVVGEAHGNVGHHARVQHVALGIHALVQGEGGEGVKEKQKSKKKLKGKHSASLGKTNKIVMGMRVFLCTVPTNGTNQIHKDQRSNPTEKMPNCHVHCMYCVIVVLRRWSCYCVLVLVIRRYMRGVMHILCGERNILTFVAKKERREEEQSQKPPSLPPPAFKHAIASRVLLAGVGPQKKVGYGLYVCVCVSVWREQEKNVHYQQLQLHSVF